MGENILRKIASTKRVEVEAMKRLFPLEALREMVAENNRSPLSVKRSILNGSGIIAEHKRRSPSKGEINPMSEVKDIAREYFEGGASAMSVLTDTPYFGGSLTDLAVARLWAPALPLLRKEFIVDEYQLYQARQFGADAILLIAAMLSAGEIMTLNDKAHELGMQTLVEIHSEEEIASIPKDADLVGVNNRDLTSFVTDIGNASRIIESLPQDAVKIAESGIRTAADMIKLRDKGFDGFLIGEAFMKTSSPGETLRRFVEFESETRGLNKCSGL
ncbi:MAG: indole-3-glycerol phosphate synthase TrpC [Muribaculaceae bacterium]|nr:indole-3-glycerol phosphate synthase TrpC [Muribaculaceae bacterium]